MTTESPDLGEVGPIFAAGEVAGEIRLALPTFVQYVYTSPMTSNRRGPFFIKEEDSSNGKPLLVVS
jgi:hypothetical protein